MSDAPGPRLFTGAAWALVLVALVLWGRDIDLPGGLSSPTTGDAAAVGRPLGFDRPPARDPLGAVAPTRLEIPAIKVNAPVVARALDKAGAIDPPSYGTPGTVGWYGGGVRPGARGTALLVGHVDTETRPAVFYHLSTLRAGDRIRVARRDGSRAEFTVEDVQVFTRAGFDAKKAYGPHDGKRAELRLVTCGGSFDQEHHSYTANVVVSAYLTGT